MCYEPLARNFFFGFPTVSSDFRFLLSLSCWLFFFPSWKPSLCFPITTGIIMQFTKKTYKTLCSVRLVSRCLLCQLCSVGRADHKEAFEFRHDSSYHKNQFIFLVDIRVNAKDFCVNSTAFACNAKLTSLVLLATAQMQIYTFSDCFHRNLRSTFNNYRTMSTFTIKDCN